MSFLRKGSFFLTLKVSVILTSILGDKELQLSFPSKKKSGGKESNEILFREDIE